ncbi:MAG TPA: ubiquitin-like domain-containing protein [Candidatus Thermoplasmatota archaeon]|nr:ubiquitin-like domain-containing protein [Candidatus Thermoplasmatota archaeon]
MPVVRFSPEFGDALGALEALEVEVFGDTVGECLRLAGVRLGASDVVEHAFEGRGEFATLARDVAVVVNGLRVRDADDVVSPGAIVEVSPLGAGPRRPEAPEGS